MLESYHRKRARRVAAKTAARPTHRQIVGRRAEDVAVEFLRSQGHEILFRNYRRRLGELDIVARLGAELIIVEVRSRASDRFGGAAASVDRRKQQRLIRTASLLLQSHRDLARCRARFDVIVVSSPEAQRPAIQWIRHAFLT